MKISRASTLNFGWKDRQSSNSKITQIQVRRLHRTTRCALDRCSEDHGHSHSLTEEEDSSLGKNTVRPRRRQRRLSGHPPTSAAVLINHTVRRGWEEREREREVRPLPQVVATLTARPRLGGEKRRASPLPPLFFSFFFLSWVRTSKTAHRQSSTPMGFGERETEELSPDTAPAGSLGVCPTTLFSRGGGTDRVTRPLSLRASPFAQTTSFLPLPVGTWLRTRERLAFFTQTGAGCSLPIPNPRRP